MRNVNNDNNPRAHAKQMIVSIISIPLEELQSNLQWNKTRYRFFVEVGLRQTRCTLSSRIFIEVYMQCFVQV